MPDQSQAQVASNLAFLEELERKVLWLSTYLIHHANHLRPSRDGLKVGGHQSSSASVATLMTALYFSALRPQDQVAVKPHASPVFHAIQYLLGFEPLEKLQRFRALGGAQSYPSRTKDRTNVDFSTGSVGLGVAATLFASLAQDYLHAHGKLKGPEGRMIALLGDAELDEGNIYEALLEGWKHDVRNLWWIIDYNRQSLDGVVNDELFGKISGFFANVGWNVVPLKYGKKLEALRHQPGGEAVLNWIDTCPNQIYSALVFKGGAAWRERLRTDLQGTSGLPAILDSHDDEALAALMTNLAGHDMESILEAFDQAQDERPHCFVAYTIKGRGLPLAGHKDNHAGLMSPAQLKTFQDMLGVPEGQEWDKYAGLTLPEAQIDRFLENVPFARRRELPKASLPALPVPAIPVPEGAAMSTQEAFGKILLGLGREQTAFSDAIMTTSPDVTVSTNLSGWVNRRGVFSRIESPDLFSSEKIPTTQKWGKNPSGQHLELGIAEMNLFLTLSQFGLAGEMFGARLLPIGTVYDPFINRGLDALIYACYQGARFMLVATPSGITLGPEGGAHQSFNTPLIGMAQDGLTYVEPAYADELAVLMGWAFDEMQRPHGGSVYFRLSTRSLNQPIRQLTDSETTAISKGAYWRQAPGPVAPIALVYTGAVAPEAEQAADALRQDFPDLGLLAITSADRLYADWQSSLLKGGTSHIAALLSQLPRGAGLITMIDAHPSALSWLGGVLGQAVAPLGVTKFGQSGDLPDLYAHHHLDADAVIDAAAALLARGDR